MAKKIFTIDLHSHLLEKHTKPKEYWKFVKKHGIDIIAITEHAEFKPEKAFEELKKTKPKNMLLIPGMEINSSIGHVLVYAKDERVFDFPEFKKKGIEIEKIIEIAKKEGFVLSIAHPWGFSYDSAAYIMGPKALEKLVKEKEIGIEAFNGMLGQLGDFVYSSRWVSRPMNFFEKLEKNRIARKIKISKLGEKARKKIDKKSREIIERTAKNLELGEISAFVTAGSDAHSAGRLGAGIIRMNLEENIDNEKFLKALKERKGIEWIGPLVKKKKEHWEVIKLPRKKVEALQAFKYAAKTYLWKKAGKKLKGHSD